MKIPGISTSAIKSQSPSSKQSTQVDKSALSQLKALGRNIKARLQAFSPMNCCSATPVLQDLQATSAPQPRLSSLARDAHPDNVSPEAQTRAQTNQSSFEPSAFTMHNDRATIGFKHHLITHGSTTKTQSNPTGRMQTSYSDAKRSSVITAGAHAKLHSKAAVKEQVTKASQVYKHTHGKLQVLAQDSKTQAPYAGDLHSSDAGVKVNDLPQFFKDMQVLKAQLSTSPLAANPTGRSEQAIVDNAVLDVKKQLMPGGNPALASDIQRFLVLLEDNQAPASDQHQVSVYTDHDTHMSKIDQTMLTPSQIAVKTSRMSLLTTELAQEYPELHAALHHELAQGETTQDADTSEIFDEPMDAINDQIEAHHNLTNNKADRRFDLHLQDIKRNTAALNLHMKANDMQPAETSGPRDHLVFAATQDEVVPRDINQLSLLHPKTLEKKAQVKEFILEKLDAIHNRMAAVDKHEGGGHRLAQAHDAVPSVDPFGPPERTYFEQMAEVMTGDPLLRDTEQGRVQQDLTPLAPGEAAQYKQIDAALYGRSNDIEEGAFTIRRPAAKDFESSWRSKPGTQTQREDMVSSGTEDIADHLWSQHHL